MITIISGTNRKGSTTRKVATQYREMLRAKGIEANFVSLEDLDVSSRNAGILQLEEKVLIPTQKFIFISPEYNGSIPGVLKSLIDVSDIRKVWWHKKALLTGISNGRAGNLRGMEHLTGILHYVKMIVHPNKLPISVVETLMDDSEIITDKATLGVINTQLDEFIAF